jgi:uroporphyrinogen-III synthase
MNVLNGRRILVTRPAHQANHLCRIIEDYGGQAVRLPAIEIAACEGLPEAGALLERLDKFQWLVFISANAVNFALGAFNGKIDQLHAMKIVAIGRATATALATAGVPAALHPETGFDSEALLAMPQFQKVSGQRFLIVRGCGGREELAHTLRSRGAHIEYLDVYRRLVPAIDCSSVRDMLNQNRLDIITVTSGETLQNLLEMLGDSYIERVAALPLVVVSGRIARIAADKGFKQIFVADSPTDISILETVIKCTTGEQSGRSN